MLHRWCFSIVGVAIRLGLKRKVNIDGDEIYIAHYDYVCLFNKWILPFDEATPVPVD
jgi:hypothetical protein